MISFESDREGLRLPWGTQDMITVSGLSFGYNGAKRSILQDMALTIPGGTITAILGPNGSGKTTLLRLLLGVLRPQQGSIQLAGRPQGSYTRREMGRLIGLVPQDEHIPFDFSILEYVLMGRAPYLGTLATPGADDHQAAAEALRTTGLADMRHRPLPNLSGGERQLAVVARALAQQPQVLLMDEPTAHLDLGNKGRLLAIMRDLVTRGVTVVLTTHDPNLAASVASYTVLMRQGEVLEAGPPEATLTGPKLSAIYDVPVQVFQVDGKRIVLLS
jgi:iron complex transport system ATP-binding protein